MTRKEAKKEGFRILTYDDAINIIAESEHINAMENGLMWDIIMDGCIGINSMSMEDVEDWFDGNDEVIFDWQLED